MRSLQRTNEDFIVELARSAKFSVAEGYYSLRNRARVERRSLVGSIAECKVLPVIAEVKFRSPAEGVLREGGDAADIARRYQAGGAAAISVLTEPIHFMGKISDLTRVKKKVSVPVLMKDVVVDPVQVRAADLAGADAILLIMSAFDRGLAEVELGEMISLAHSLGLEVLLETHTEAEYDAAATSETDIIGINNRDMKSLGVSLDTSRRILSNHRHTKPVVCESGIRTKGQAVALRKLGADALLIGSALMRSTEPEAFLRELVG